jgi:predicted dehydrogenase
MKLAAGAAVVRPGSGGTGSVRLPDVVRVAIIGLEGHYSEITDAARRLPNLRVTAVAERPALQQQAKRNPVLSAARFYEDYRRLLDTEKLDVVAVCGENGVRAEVVQACAARRLPVVAEKPLALTLEELRAVKKVVTTNEVPLSMLLPMRFYAPYQAMREIVQRGEVGDVVSIAAQKSYKLGSRPDWMKRRESYGGTIPYIGIHMVDLMRWIAGREFVEAAAFQSNVGAPEVGEMENNAAVLFRLDNRGTASLRLDYLRPEAAPTHGDDRLRIAGTRGVVEYQMPAGLTLITRGVRQIPLAEGEPARSLFVDFLESLYGGPPHLIRPEEVFRVTEIVLKAREAAERHRIVSL